MKEYLTEVLLEAGRKRRRNLYAACRTALIVVPLLGTYAGHGENSRHVDLTGRWQLTTHEVRGKQERFTIDLIESGSLLVGTVTPEDSRPLTIRDGYYVGTEIRFSANARKGLFVQVIQISGHIEGDRMILNVKQGSHATDPALADRMQVISHK